MSEVFVRVAVRIRPLLPKEKLHRHQKCVRLVPSSTQVLFGSERLFSFDHTFGPTANQDEVYKSCVQPLVEHLITGYNATIFCYGQTGSGKTYTMEGGHLDEEGGIIDRVAQDVFSLLEEKKNNNDSMETTVWVTYMELYREELRDLLEQPGVHKVFHIREDEKGNTVVMGAKEIVINSAEELLSVLQTGRTLRQIAITGMNERSSRSHTIITLRVAQCCHNDNSSVKSVRTSKLRLIDLAGSERAGKTGNTGVRLKESVHINTGLLALSKVISALSNPARAGHSIHIPYRDAKITRLLRDALGGTSHTLMVVCVSPSHHSADETLGALHFASKARHIRNSPKATCTEVKSCIVARLAELEFEVQTLRELLKEKEMVRERSGGRGSEGERFRQYRLLAQEAEALLLELSDTSPSESFHDRLHDWQDRLAIINNAHLVDNDDDSDGGGDQHDHEMVLKLREELNRCQEALNLQEQLLEQKNEELRQVQTEAEKSLQKNTFDLKGSDKEKEHNHIQIVNDHLRRGIVRLQSAAAEMVEEAVVSGKSDKRPHSDPLTRRSYEEQPPRKIPSCPAALDRALPALRINRRCLLPESNEKNEMFCDFVRQQDRSQLNEGEGHCVSHTFTGFLNQTWQIQQKNGNRVMQLPGNKGTKDHHIRTRPSVTQRKIQDLSVNIRMKEELLVELDKTETMIQAVNGHVMHGGDNREPGILGELSLQNQQTRKDVYLSLQQMRLERDQLQNNFMQQEQMPCTEDAGQSKVFESSWLEQQEEQVLQKREELQELQQELRSRDEVVRRREACLQERNKLERKMLRSSQALSQDLLCVSMQLKSVEEHLHSNGDGGITTEELEKERDVLQKRTAALHAQLKENRVLSAGEEYNLLQLEEAIEALDGALEFKNNFIKDKQRKLLITDPARVCDVISKLKELSQPEASEMLIKYFNKVVCLRENERHLRLHCEELELHVAELEAALGDMEAAMQRLALEADRRFTKQCKDYQGNIERLSVKLQEDSCGQQQPPIPNRLQHLEKELFYYKSYNRKLKRMLQGLGGGAQRPEDQELEQRQTQNINLQAGRKKCHTNPESAQTQREAATTRTVIHMEQTERRTHNISHTKRHIPQIPGLPMSSDLQAHKPTKLSEHEPLQTLPQSHSQDGNVREVAGQHLEVTPLRLSRRRVRQISRPEVRVSGSATRRQQSDGDKDS